MFDALRSAWYGAWLVVQERTARVRGARPEAPVGRLPSCGAHADSRIAELRRRYGVAFEAHAGRASALQGYEYLDWLDAAHATWAQSPPRPAELHDVGCGGFAYARALHAFFAPGRLVGIDVEGHRRLRDGVNRHERVLGHLQDLPGAEFVVADYARWNRSADLVTAFFPFVTPGPLLAWRLPLRLLRPAELFEAVHRNLTPDGRLCMVNHSRAEHDAGAAYARAARLQQLAAVERPRLTRADVPPVVVSLWTRLSD